MSDLISRMSLKQSIVVSAILEDKKTLEQIIDEEPTIDAVPVVRCRDCKRWSTVLDRKVAGYGFCKSWSQLLDTKWNDFCSRGERRTDE